MANVTEEKRILVAPDGVAELRIDRVMKQEGAPERRLKVLRQQGPADVLLTGKSELHVLPPSCRVVYFGRQATAFVIEQGPCVRSIGWEWGCREGWNDVQSRGCLPKYGLTLEDQKRRRFRFAFPYTVFFVIFSGNSFDSLRLFYRPEPIRSLSDSLFYPGVTNYRRSHEYNGTIGIVCAGSTSPKPSRSELNGIERLITHFWGAPFNDHWTECFDATKKRVPELCTPWDWEYHSKRDSYWPLRANWEPSIYSIQSFLEGVCGMSCEQEVDFSLFAGCIQKGPHWQNRQPVETHNGFVLSPSLAILAGGRSIELGQEFKLLSSLNGLQVGQTYRIQHFFEPNAMGLRAVQLEGVPHPIPIENAWWDCFKATGEEQGSSIQLNGLEVRIGSLFKVKKDKEFPGLSKTSCYTITDIQRDLEGDVLVRVNQEKKWIYLTQDGGILSEAIVFLVADLKEDRFSFNETTLSVGEFIALDRDTSPSCVKEKRFLKVASLRRGEGDQVLVLFERIHEPCLLFSDNQFCFKWNPVVFEMTERMLKFEKNVIDLGSGNMLILSSNSFLQDGKIYEGARFVMSTRKDADPYDVDLVVEFGNEMIPVVAQSQFVFETKMVSIEEAYQSGSLFLMRGMYLKCLCHDFTGINQDEVVEVLGFAKNRLMPECMDMIFTNGRGCLLSQNLGQTFVRVEGEVSQPFSSEEVSNLPNLPLMTEKTYSVGAFAVFTSPYGEISQEHLGKLFEVKDVRVDWCGTKRLLVHQWGQRNRFNDIPIRYFSVMQTVTLWFKGTKVQLTPETELPCKVSPFLQEEQKKLERRGLEVGTDVDGKSVHIGDFVMIVERSWMNSDNMRIQDLGLKTVALVVHNAQAGGLGEPFGYLLFDAPNSVVSQHPLSQTYGFSSCPERFYTEVLYDYRIGANRFSDCRTVKVSREEEIKDEEKVNLTFTIGNKVHVKAGVTPRYGWGSVVPEMVGILKEIEGEDALVAFPAIPEWVGRLEELEQIFLEKGDLVMVKPDVKHPRFGWGQVKPGSQGRVRDILPNDFVEVIFDDQICWYGLVEELHIVDVAS